MKSILFSLLLTTLAFASEEEGAEAAPLNFACDVLLTPNTNFSAVRGHPNMFVQRSGKDVFIFKAEMSNETADLNLANFVFGVTQSQLFVANVAHGEFKIPSSEISRDQLPPEVSFALDSLFGTRTIAMSRYHFIDGRVPQISTDFLSEAERRRESEDNRIFNGEAERIFNWIRKYSAQFDGYPLVAELVLDTSLFHPENASRRPFMLTTKSYVFEAGPYSFILSYGKNIVIANKKFYLIDPT